MGTKGDENEEEDDEIGWDEVDVKDRIGFEKEWEEDDDTKEVGGEDTNLVLDEEEEEMGNEEIVFVSTGADDDTTDGDRKDEDDDVGEDDDCVNVVVREEGDANEVAGDRLVKILAPQRGGAESAATTRIVAK